MVQCMFDTNIFNRILDGVVALDDLRERVIGHATHIQRDEINNTSNVTRRDALQQVFQDVTSATVATDSFVLDVSRLDEASLGGDRVVPTESLVWGVTAWGQGKWGVGDLYTTFKTELDALNGGKPNNVHDALIAETSIRGGYLLVTEDRDLAFVTKNSGGSCVSLNELLQNLRGEVAT